jgi:hypothetical protein
MASPPIHGVILGPLKELYPDRIVIGDRTLFLRDGEASDYEIGMVLEVVYMDRDGRCDVEPITPQERRQRRRSSPPEA